jgi:prepilin-type N-terminal cleavage/methylation domain-containing protein
MNSLRLHHWKRYADPRPSQGLTLIEMLVVLLIMGLLVSVTALSIGLAGRGDAEDAARTAEDLSRLFEHAAQQALVRGEVLGLSLGLSLGTEADQPMQWWRWTSESTSGAAFNAGISTVSTARWQAQAEAFMPVVTVPEQFKLQLTDSPSAVQPDRLTDSGPQIVFMPARESIEFDVRIQHAQTGQSLARIWVSEQGSVDWSVM